MIDLLQVRPGGRVLEVGTGLGYQTALLASLGAQVWSVDVVEEFVEAAAQRLHALDLTDITLRVGDGSRGWADQAPFDAILVSAAAKELPVALVAQLVVGGRMVLPLTGGEGQQALTAVERTAVDAATVAEVMPVHFTALETLV
jgi:protein-L-isoaspartate(D-aspartate) O-methyltransferase